MDDEAGPGPFSGGFFQLVGPATIVGHGLSVEGLLIQLGRIIRIRHRGVVDQNDQRLVFYIHVFVVIPVKFGCHHAIADKNDLRILEGYAFNRSLAPGHQLLARAKR